jgi:hypothetical protein
MFINSPILHQLPPEKILRLLEKDSISKIKGYNTLFNDKISEPEIALITNEIKTQRINNKILHRNILESEKTLKAMEVKLQRLQNQRKRTTLGRASSLHSVEELRANLQSGKSLSKLGSVANYKNNSFGTLNSLNSFSEVSTEKLRERHNRTLSELIKEERHHTNLEQKLKDVIVRLKNKANEVKKEEGLINGFINNNQKANRDLESRVEELIDLLGNHYKTKKLKDRMRQSLFHLPGNIVR